MKKYLQSVYFSRPSDFNVHVFDQQLALYDKDFIVGKKKAMGK